MLHEGKPQNPLLRFGQEESNVGLAGGMIDIHSHIIPKADDGSRYLGETKSMLKEAHDQGFRRVIATPHYRCRHNRMTKSQILEGLRKVQEIAREIDPAFRVESGAELFYSDEIVDALASGRALTLGDTRYVLIEFSPAIVYQDIFQAVRRLSLLRYIPVLAHIERYQCLRKKGYMDELIQMGAYMQMNFSSLADFKHPSNQLWCRKMVRDGKIHLLGTDMHRLDYRPPDTRAAVRWVEHKVGRECLERLTIDQPAKLLSGELI